MKAFLAALVIALIAAIVIEQETSLVAIQPIGALPDGVTLWMWRGENQQFFESPDAICLRTMGSVTILCRMGALAAIVNNKDRIITRLSYSERVYLWSTGGQGFER